MEDDNLQINGDATITGHLQVEGSLSVDGDVHVADPEQGGGFFFHDCHLPDDGPAVAFTWPPDGFARMTAVRRDHVTDEIIEETVVVPYWKVPS